MPEKEKLEHKKITLAISAASLVPLSAAAFNQAAHIKEQRDDQSTACKELDGSKSFIQEEKKSSKQEGSISDSIYAKRVREEKRMESKARKASEEFQEHSAREILLQNMEPAAPVESQAVSTETAELTVPAASQSQALQIEALQPAFLQMEPESRELPVFTAQNTISETNISTEPEPALPAAETLPDSSKESFQAAQAVILPEPDKDITEEVETAEPESDLSQISQDIKDESTLLTEPEKETENPAVPKQEVQDFIEEITQNSLDPGFVLSDQSEEIDTAIDIPAPFHNQAQSVEEREEAAFEQETADTDIDIEEVPASESESADLFTEPAEETETVLSEPLVSEPVSQVSDQITDGEEIVQDSSLNDRIAQAALGLVGVSNGQQCTEVVNEALVQAGVDASLGWPADYLSYGSVVEDPVAGNLVYYDNGGQGLDHIAVYVGDGQAVHGNFTTESGTIETVIYDVQYQPEVTPVYIQIEV